MPLALGAAAAKAVEDQVKLMEAPTEHLELDAGEAQAIQLCLHLRADKVILDDALGRAAARHLGG